LKHEKADGRTATRTVSAAMRVTDAAGGSRSTKTLRLAMNGSCHEARWPFHELANTATLPSSWPSTLGVDNVVDLNASSDHVPAPKGIVKVRSSPNCATLSDVNAARKLPGIVAGIVATSVMVAGSKAHIGIAKYTDLDCENSSESVALADPPLREVVGDFDRVTSLFEAVLVVVREALADSVTDVMLTEAVMGTEVLVLAERVLVGTKESEAEGTTEADDVLLRAKGEMEIDAVSDAVMQGTMVPTNPAKGANWSSNGRRGFSVPVTGVVKV
jgi:hypothetical protein